MFYLHFKDDSVSRDEHCEDLNKWNLFISLLCQVFHYKCLELFVSISYHTFLLLTFCLWWTFWGIWFWKQVSRARISNYIPQFTVGCNYLCMPYMLLVPKSSFFNGLFLLHTWVVMSVSPFPSLIGYGVSHDQFQSCDLEMMWFGPLSMCYNPLATKYTAVLMYCLPDFTEIA